MKLLSSSLRSRAVRPSGWARTDTTGVRCSTWRSTWVRSAGTWRLCGSCFMGKRGHMIALQKTTDIFPPTVSVLITRPGLKSRSPVTDQPSLELTVFYFYSAAQHQILLSVSDLRSRRCHFLRRHKERGGLVCSVAERRRSSDADQQRRRAHQCGRRPEAQWWEMAHGKWQVLFVAFYINCKSICSAVIGWI